MAKEVDAGLERIANTEFYSPFIDGDADEEITERVNLAAVFTKKPPPNESLKGLIEK